VVHLTEELEASRTEVRTLTTNLRAANQSIESLRSLSKEYEKSLNDTQQVQQQLTQLRSENTKLKTTKSMWHRINNHVQSLMVGHQCFGCVCVCVCVYANDDTQYKQNKQLLRNQQQSISKRFES
jgi:DNA repair exonuclease SbcCD ATPase subunit